MKKRIKKDTENKRKNKVTKEIKNMQSKQKKERDT